MNKFFYFKLAFLATFAGLFTGTLLYGMFDLDFSNTEAIGRLFLRTFVKAFITAIMLGLLNIYFKLGAAKKQ